MSRTLSGLFLVGADNRPRKRKRTNRENPRRVPGQIGKIPGKVPKGQKRTKKEGQVQIGKPPRLKHPRLAALESDFLARISLSGLFGLSLLHHLALTATFNDREVTSQKPNSIVNLFLANFAKALATSTEWKSPEIQKK